MRLKGPLRLAFRELCRLVQAALLHCLFGLFQNLFRLLRRPLVALGLLTLLLRGLFCPIQGFLRCLPGLVT